jgi:hypothetical protein
LQAATPAGGGLAGQRPQEIDAIIQKTALEFYQTLGDLVEGTLPLFNAPDQPDCLSHLFLDVVPGFSGVPTLL